MPTVHSILAQPLRRGFRVAATFCLGLLALPGARADDARLSLLDAVRMAEASAPDIQARRAALTSAEDAVSPAGQLPDPQLVAGVENLPVTSGDAFSLTDDFMTMRKVGISQAFPRREKRALRTARAEAMAGQARARLITEQLSVREAVARAWIARAAAERRLALLQSLRSRAEATVAAAAAALSAGRGSAADGIAARSSQQQLEDRIDQAGRDVEEAQADFTRWLPDAAGRPLGEAPDWTDLGGDPSRLIGNIAHHRELLAYDAAEQAADADVALARAEKRPDWSLEMAYAQRGPRYSNMVTVQVRVDLPLFAASRQDPTIASKQAAVAQLEAEREVALRMHTADLRKVVATWRSACARAQRYERELLPLADDRADAALASYRGGRGDLQTSLAAFDNAIEQRIAYTDVTNTLGQSWAALHFAFPNEER
ncbi:TolC family protein [Dokdonella soli]|uniref:TolC family protein n=1 Tax=Dokdonella soli TaxID=529810 RepID=A0ABN1IS13_9GAMM